MTFKQLRVIFCDLNWFSTLLIESSAVSWTNIIKLLVDLSQNTCELLYYLKWKKSFH